ncbi:hypothetical protein WJX72_003024 [[Myrmecia] bisecta]|uniref:Uncharacterized protein n=1 Tax=[Myrmecia] bisecta TaxID=41462 RepID=A0AAW1R673_9CHLO
MLCRIALLLACALLALVPAEAVKSGDEVFAATNKTGNFYIFADGAIHVIDPVALTVVKNITKDQDGNPLVAVSPDAASGSVANKSRTWNDVVYTQDPARSLYYLFVNEGDTYTDASGNPFSYITVIDTLKQQIIARLKADARLVHMYAVQQTKEVWAHSDYAGTFTVVSLDQADKLDTVVPKFVTRPGHGKLLVDDALYPVAYSSNVAEAYIGKFNLTSRKRVGAFAYNSSNAAAPTSAQCAGTHSLVYSSVNSHAYFECVGGTGMLEWNTLKDEVVAFHTNVTGYLSATPGNDQILATDGTSSRVNIITPAKNGVASKVSASISVPGQPARAPIYYSNSSSATPGPATDYLMFFPLYRDTNINNIAAAKKAGGDVLDSTYLTKPIDCQYSPAVSAASVDNPSAGLKLATASDGTVLSSGCGSCAAGVSPRDASQWNASLSGFGLTSFTQVADAAKKGSIAVTKLIPAGSTATVPNAAATANACSYSSEGNRDADRGGPYIATIADFPQPSIYIVDATATGGPAVAGFVKTNLNPRKTVWVPYHSS